MTASSTPPIPVYQPHSKHRNATPGASQWTITASDESACFRLAFAKLWTFKSVSWGLHFHAPYAPAAQPHTLGLGFVAGLQEPVKIAKFVTNQGIVHGYPVAHWVTTNDRPPASILAQWQACQHISLTVRSKIQRGKKSGL